MILAIGSSKRTRSVGFFETAKEILVMVDFSVKYKKFWLGWFFLESIKNVSWVKNLDDSGFGGLGFFKRTRVVGFLGKE